VLQKASANDTCADVTNCAFGVLVLKSQRFVWFVLYAKDVNVSNCSGGSTGYTYYVAHRRALRPDIYEDKVLGCMACCVQVHGWRESKTQASSCMFQKRG
jgi:hypothetical protein